MHWRRLTAQYLPCFRTTGIAYQTAALRDFAPLYVADGSQPEELTLSISSPLTPRKPTLSRTWLTSELCHEPTYAVQQIATYSMTSSAATSRFCGTVMP